MAISSALIVLFGLTTVIMTTLHQSARVNGRVDATQRARLALYQVIDGLHSACVAPQIAPVQAGSTGTSLRYLHQTGSAVAPTPVLSQVDLNGGTPFGVGVPGDRRLGPLLDLRLDAVVDTNSW